MKFLHLSDLHLGKRVNEFSMAEDQKYILDQIIEITEEENPDGIFIAGDVYDKSVPSVEAVGLFNDFLNQMAQRHQRVFVISGNHDSPERLAFASELISHSGIYISPVYDGCVEPISLEDEYGTVNIFLLPFIKPVHVRRAFPEEPAESYTEALGVAVSHMEVDESQRNVLIAHQFVTGAKRSESEEISVGGMDNVDVSVFDAFDYVALGHIHGPQHIGRDSVRYCGTPLKYSFSEAGHCKSVTVVELMEKGNLQIRTRELIPQRDMRELKGTYEELASRENYAGTAVEDYIHITLTDEDDILDAMAKLRVIYPNLMKLDYDNKRTRGSTEITEEEDRRGKTPLELLEEFYRQQNHQDMSEEQTTFASGLIEKIWEEKI